ncbi:MAG: hypothetical protein ACJA2S_000887 [Cyclobacteriaceae bacterium]|jgi:hypothetical protein
MRVFPQLLEKHKDELIIISYNKDSYEDMKSILVNKPKPWDFLESTNPNWQIANVWETTDSTNLVSELKLYAYPSYYIVDEEGVIESQPMSALYGVESSLNYFSIPWKSFQEFWLKDFVMLKIIHRFYLVFNTLFAFALV